VIKEQQKGENDQKTIFSVDYFL